MLGQAKWQVAPRRPAAEKRLIDELKIPSLFAAILVSRGYEEPSAAHAFLHPRLEDLHDPSLLPDFEPAVRAIVGALERKERIFVHGDFDADGITSASLVTRFLRGRNADVIAYVPHRRTGHGIHSEAIRMAIEAGVGLFLTCDCGVADREPIRALQAAGITVVVTDHHPPIPPLPECAAVVDPQRADSIYPFRQLCGAGVALKLCAGVARELGLPIGKFYQAYLDLATIGTIADVMPLVGENRIICRHGLELLSQTKKVGIRELLRTSKRDSGKLSATDVGFGLGPRINAVNRVDSAEIALQLMLEQDEKKARELATHLEECNQIRKQRQAEACAEAEEMLVGVDWSQEKIIVLAKQGWHPGLNGLVAGNLREKYYRPAFVIGVNDGIAGGSARSIPGFDLHEAIEVHRAEWLVSGGGHAMAAGVGLEPAKLAGFQNALRNYARAILSDDDVVPKLDIDAEARPGEATLASCAAMELLEPCGEGNCSPKYLTCDLRVMRSSSCSNPEHGFIEVQGASGPRQRAFLWNIGEEIQTIREGDCVDLVYRAEVKTGENGSDFKWVVEDLHVVA